MNWNQKRIASLLSLCLGAASAASSSVYAADTALETPAASAAAQPAADAPASGAAQPATDAPASGAGTTSSSTLGGKVSKALNTWNKTGPEPFGVAAFVQFELGKIYTSDDDHSVIGIDYGFEVRVHDRVGIGFDYVEAGAIFGPSGKLYTPYVFMDLRPRDTKARVQPFVSGGIGLVDVSSGNEAFTAHVGAGVRMQLAKNLGVRLDARLQQPLEAINTDYAYDEFRSYSPSEIRFFQTRLGLYASW